MGKSSLGWAVFRQSKVLIVLALVSVIFLVTGVLLAQFAAPAPSKREPVQPGLITAKVEAREIRSTVVARADISFANPVEINPRVPEGASSPVVTGLVPKVGDVVESGDVILEVSGRPIFALAGKFPAYRSLSAGVKGPDVSMLRNALQRLGYLAGAKSDIYDAALARAVARLYTDHGYRAPGSSDRAKQIAVRDAEDALTDAKTGLKTANRALKQATATDDKISLKESVKSAKRALTRAQETLNDAKQDSWAQLPAAEVVFLTALPRRVDAVNVSIGQVIGESVGNSEDDTANGAALVLSGNTIKTVAEVPISEAALLKEGDLVEIEASADIKIAATVSTICPEAATASKDNDPTQRCAVGIKLGDLGQINRSELLGNVQATIQIGVTAQDALIIPVAAVSAGSAGEARVQLVSKDSLKSNAATPETTWVVIEPGLSAEGYVEIKSATPALAVGDLVVLGIAGNSETEEQLAQSAQSENADPPR